MGGDLAMSRGSTHKSNIIARLRKEGKHSLITAIQDGRISAFAVGVQEGYFKRPPTQGIRTSAARRRQMVFDALGCGNDPEPGDELSARDAAFCQELWLGPA